MDNQRLALEAVAGQRGWTVAAVYEDMEGTGDDQAADCLRYAAASRPWVRVEQPHLSGVTINLLWGLRERERLRW